MSFLTACCAAIMQHTCAHPRRRGSIIRSSILARLRRKNVPATSAVPRSQRPQAQHVSSTILSCTDGSVAPSITYQPSLPASYTPTWGTTTSVAAADSKNTRSTFVGPAAAAEPSCGCRGAPAAGGPSRPAMREAAAARTCQSCRRHVAAIAYFGVAVPAFSHVHGTSPQCGHRGHG